MNINSTEIFDQLDDNLLFITFTHNGDLERIGAFRSTCFPSDLQLRKNRAFGLYHFESDWALPKKLEGSFSNEQKAKDAVKVCFKGGVFSSVSKKKAAPKEATFQDNRPDKPTTTIKQRNVYDHQGVQMETCFGERGYATAKVTAKNGSVVELVKEPSEHFYSVVNDTTDLGLVGSSYTDPKRVAELVL